MKLSLGVSGWAAGSVFLSLAMTAYAQYTAPVTVTVAQADQPAAGSSTTGRETTSESRTITRQEVITEAAPVAVEAEDKNWDISGPIRLRSADPEELGEIEFKTIFNYGTSSDGTDDDVEYEGELEWGFAPNHELILAVPVELGDGGVDGNADLEVGWHWRLWKEDRCGWLPAFAIRNILRVPSGYHSSGVDWTLKGLITKSIIPDKFRFHINPYLTSANGDNLESEDETNSYRLFPEEGDDPRHFRWGVITGVDYKLSKCLDLIVDYIHETGEMEGERNQHIMEVGLDWDISKHQTLGFVTRAGLDGDSIGENWGFGVSYILSFDAPALGKHKSHCQ